MASADARHDSLAEDASEAAPGAPGHRAHGVGRDVVVLAIAVPVHLVRPVVLEAVDDRGPPLLLPVRLDALADREGVARLRLLLPRGIWRLEAAESFQASS